MIRSKKGLSWGTKLLIGVICIVLVVYAFLSTSMVNIPEASFTLGYLNRETPGDEFSVVRSRKFDKRMVEVGDTWAREDGRLLVVSLVRNCENSIWCMEKKIKVLSSVFKSVHVVVFENDSEDETRLRLLDYACGRLIMGGDNVKVTVVNPFTMAENEEVCRSTNKAYTNNIKCGLHGAGSKRIAKMSFLRNKALEYVYRHQKDYNTLLLTDLDIIGRIFPRGIQETVGYLRKKRDIGFVSFRGYFRGGGFFDPYAFRGKDFISQSPLGTLLMCMKGYFTMPSGKGLEPVSSAHSGGVFANLPLPPHLRYSAHHVVTVPLVTDLYLCEHITLMERVPNNFVNTNMTYLVRANV